MGRSEGFLSPLQVAQYTGMNVEDVRSLLEEGELNSEELNGRQRIRKTELDRWLDEEVNRKQLLDLADRMKEDVDPSKIADLLDMEEKEVKEFIEKREG